MNLMQEANRRGVGSLVHAARAGWHTLPQDLVDDYTNLEALAAQYGTPEDPNPEVTEQLAQVVTDRLIAATAGGAADALIVGYVRPALNQFLTDFLADVEKAGAYATEPTGSALHGASAAAQQAHTRLVESPLRWTSIRTSWRVLRGLSMSVTADPAGLDSLHAEVANIYELRSVWDPTSPASRLASPWKEGVFHLRLKWLLDHDAEIWAPTATEQTEAWIANNPELVVR